MSVPTKADYENPGNADYEIPLKLNEDKQVVAFIPDPLEFGKTVHYKSTDGFVEMEFPKSGSPFLNDDKSEKTIVTSDDPPVGLKKKGKFICSCYITTSDGVKHGYESGGNHVVK